MPSAPQIDQVAERVERLLVRYEELQRTNALLAAQVEVLTQERDSLKSRLSLMESYGKSPSTRMVLPRPAAEPPFDPFRRNSDPFGGLLRPR